MKLHAPMIRPRADGFTEVWIPCEHSDYLRDQVRAVLTFKRVGGCWSIAVDDDLLRQNPEALHAVLGLALMAMRHHPPAHTDGDVNG